MERYPILVREIAHHLKNVHISGPEIIAISFKEKKAMIIISTRKLQ